MHLWEAGGVKMPSRRVNIRMIGTLQVRVLERGVVNDSKFVLRCERDGHNFSTWDYLDCMHSWGDNAWSSN
jgi:hypothetical protein